MVMRAPSRGNILLWTFVVVSLWGQYNAGVLSQRVGRSLREKRPAEPAVLQAVNCI